MKFRLSILLCLFLFSSSLLANVLVSAPNPFSTPAFYPVTNVRFNAAEFTLSSTELVSSIDVFLMLGSPSNDVYDFTLQNALTGPITAYANASFIPPGTSTGQMYTINVGAILSPGTYYLVNSEVPANGFGGWVLSDGNYVQTDGTVADGMWVSIDSGATYSFFGPNTVIDPNTNQLCTNCFAAQFIVNGTPVNSTPEPASAALVIVGLLGSLVTSVRRLLR